MLKNRKKIFLFLSFTGLFLFVYYRPDRLQSEDKGTEASDMKDDIYTKRKPAAEQTPLIQEKIDTVDVPLQQESNEMTLSQNDPIQKILDRYGINSKNQLKVNYDTWFKSTKYVQVHASEYFEGMGRVIESHNNFKVVALVEGKANPDNYPPLVISHATNLPVPITGDLLVKFQNSEELDQLVNFLEEDSELQNWVQNVIITNELKDIRWILVKMKKKSEIMDLYSALLKLVGQHNIEAVQPDNRPQLKN